MRWSVRALCGRGALSMGRPFAGRVQRRCHQDRRHERPVGPLSDLSGQGSVWRQEGDRGLLQIATCHNKIEVVFADHQNKPDVGSTSRASGSTSTRSTCIVDVPNSSVALAVNALTREKNKIFLDLRRGDSDLTGKACSPNTVHWTYDTFAQANVTGLAMVKSGVDTWFFLTADYAFGQDLEKDTTNVVLKSGGKVLGAVRHPLNTSDFSSFLLQAQSSKAKVDRPRQCRRRHHQRDQAGGRIRPDEGRARSSPLLVFITDIDSVGLETAQGLLLAEAFYWDLNDDTRAFSKRFMERIKRLPTAAQAGVYSSVAHYLKAVKAAGTTDAAAVMKIMKDTPINDFSPRTARSARTAAWCTTCICSRSRSRRNRRAAGTTTSCCATIPGNEAFQPLELSRCPLVKKFSLSPFLRGEGWGEGQTQIRRWDCRCPSP